VSTMAGGTPLGKGVPAEGGGLFALMQAGVNWEREEQTGAKAKGPPRRVRLQKKGSLDVPER